MRVIPGTPLVRCLKKIIYESGYRVDILIAGQMLLSHPSYPSLLSFSDTLHYMGIHNEAYKMTFNELTGDSTKLLHIKKIMTLLWYLSQ